MKFSTACFFCEREGFATNRAYGPAGGRKSGVNRAESISQYEAINDRASLFVTGEVSITTETPGEVVVVDEDAVNIVVPPATFAGLQIASGPLYYNGTSYEIKDRWDYSSYNAYYGKTAGSTFFNFLEMGALFEKDDFSKWDGNIDNLLDPFNGWHLPNDNGNIYSNAYFSNMLHGCNGFNRAGSSVNNNSNKHWVNIVVSNVNYCGQNEVRGKLFFPDGKIISGCQLEYFDQDYDGDFDIDVRNNITSAQLDNYIAQGCLFLPMCGFYANDSFQGINALGAYMLHKEYIEEEHEETPTTYNYDYYRYFSISYGDDIPTINSSPRSPLKSSNYIQVYLVKEIE